MRTRLQLWPRFHVGVSKVLDACQPAVEELSVPLSARGARLQHALLEAVDECLKELRSINQSVDISQLSVENALFKSFDTIVRMQLEPMWHKTSKRTRALVQDLQTLRKLLNFLVSFDCVTYYEYLETIFDAAGAMQLAVSLRSTSLRTKQNSRPRSCRNDVHMRCTACTIESPAPTMSARSSSKNASPSSSS